MILGIDCETQGLDASKFILGCILSEKGVPEIYHSKEEMWIRILKLGLTEKKRKRNLYVYAHNMNYDLTAILPKEDTSIVWLNTRPFIARLDNITFLDTMNIYGSSLKELGKTTGLEKLETPDELKTGNEVEFWQKPQIEKYCIRDTEIVMNFIKMLKKRLKKEGVPVRNIFSISQIAVKYMLKKLAEKDKGTTFYKKEERRVVWTKHKGHIAQAYRGGRVECFKTGKTKGVTYIDVNNLYGYASTKMKYPDLKSEKFEYAPLRNKTIEETIRPIGISKVIITNNKDKIGIIPIRTDTRNNYYPKEKKKIIGTYTNHELRYAIRQGYTIEDIEWTISYKETENPFGEIIKELYEKRNKTEEPFNRYLYKSIMNHAFGKFAQKNVRSLILKKPISDAPKYISRDFKIINRIGDHYLYKREIKEELPKPYTNPIIPTLITAQARTIMHKEMKKIPLKDLIYSDTDSIVFRNNHVDKFDIGDKLGQFKIEEQKEEIMIYSNKTYNIGNKMKIAGVRKRYIPKEQFMKGSVENRKMKTIKTAKSEEELGTFTTEKRDLKMQALNHAQRKAELQNTNTYIDASLHNISYFIRNMQSNTEKE